MALNNLAWLLGEARSRQLTGVELKDDSAPALETAEAAGSFLLAPP